MCVLYLKLLWGNVLAATTYEPRVPSGIHYIDKAPAPRYTPEFDPNAQASP